MREKIEYKIGFEVEEIRTNIDRWFPIKRLDVPEPKIAKPSNIADHDNLNVIDDKVIDDENLNDIDITTH